MARPSGVVHFCASVIHAQPAAPSEQAILQRMCVIAANELASLYVVPKGSGQAW